MASYTHTQKALPGFIESQCAEVQRSSLLTGGLAFFLLYFTNPLKRAFLKMVTSEIHVGSLAFQVPGTQFHENLIQYLDGVPELAFLTRTLNDSVARGRQIAN